MSARKMSSGTAAKLQGSLHERDFQDDSTAAPSEPELRRWRDDASSDFTDGWRCVDADDAEVPIGSGGAARLVPGRLVEGPDGQPTRIFRTSAELRQARLEQMRSSWPSPKTQQRQPKAGVVAAKKAAPKESAKEAAPKVAAPKEAAAPGERPQRRPASATVPSGAAAFGAHRTLGAPSHAHSLPCGHIPFRDLASSRATDKQALAQSWKGDDLKKALDKKSLEELRDMGLWQHMPARNPVVTQRENGYDWHLGFQDFQHTLGGVPDARPVERPAQAEELHRQLDKLSREQLREGGMWERCPVKNPVVTQTAMGAQWHVSPF